MEKSPSPFICVTCTRPLPADLTREDAPRYIAQLALPPTSDDAYNFANEAQTLTHYVQAIAEVLGYASKEMDQETHDTLFALIEDLAAEAGRRLALSCAAAERDAREASTT
jgi:hypothetical protein